MCKYICTSRKATRQSRWNREGSDCPRKSGGRLFTSRNRFLTVRYLFYVKWSDLDKLVLIYSNFLLWSWSERDLYYAQWNTGQSTIRALQIMLFICLKSHAPMLALWPIIPQCFAHHAWNLSHNSHTIENYWTIQSMGQKETIHILQHSQHFNIVLHTAGLSITKIAWQK